MRVDLARMEMIEEAAVNRGRHAARAWLKYLHSTGNEKWEQEWEIEQLWRLPAGGADGDRG